VSAPLAGKFQDHYKVLDIEAKSDLEKIHQAYGKLAQLYHPRNAKTGDQARFDAVNLAYEVLSDAGLRAEFDKLKGGGEEKAEFMFSGLNFFAALGHETALRAALLCVLYDRRRLAPFTPGISMRRVENMLETTSEGLNFALWYLKQRNLVTSDDKSNLMITVEGMDYLETNPPTPETVMPLVRTATLAVLIAEPQAEPKVEPAAAAPAVTHKELTPTGALNLKRIREALAR
jgi:hypothetical protein